MALKIYGLDDSKQWDTIVHSFKEYDVYWMGGYVKAFKIHGDGEPLLIYYEDEKVRGINVIMKRDVADDPCFHGKIEPGKYFDITTPYGYGGWLIEGQNPENLFRIYNQEMKKRGIISEFVRFHPILKNHEKCTDEYEVVRLGEVVHMDLSSPEFIWENITSKNRNVIRKALKNNIKIYNGRFPDIYREFQKLYNQTMDRDAAVPYYYFDERFYKSVLEDLPENAQVFFAELDGKVIAASILLMANGHMNYHLSGNLKEYGSMAPTNLLLYKAALWGSENGYKTLYLGGGVGSEEDSLFKFKRAFFKGELNHFYIAKKVFDMKRYRELIAIRGTLEGNYFPQYRTRM